MKRKRTLGKPVRVKPSGYQPSRKQLREDVRINASPEEVLRSVLRPRAVRFEEQK